MRDELGAFAPRGWTDTEREAIAVAERALVSLRRAEPFAHVEAEAIVVALSVSGLLRAEEVNDP